MEEKQRKIGERSSFAVTCNLLSQFLKENRNFGEIGIEKLHCSLEMEKNLFWPPTTMNLFPGSNVSAEKRNEPDLSEQSATMAMDPPPQLQDKDAIFKAPKRVDLKDNEINAQLTIFYDGKMMVFDNFPSKKAQELMEMASKGGALPNSAPAPSSQPEPIAPGDLTMPIARRASLHRFLEKRKERINSQAPYMVHGSSELEETPAKSEKSITWLGLGHKPSFSLDLKR